MSNDDVIEVGPTGRVVEATRDRRWRIAGQVALWVLSTGVVGYGVAWFAGPHAGSSPVISWLAAAGLVSAGIVSTVLIVAGFVAVLLASVSPIAALVYAYLGADRRFIGRLLVTGAVLAVFWAITRTLPNATAALAIHTAS